MTFVTPKSQEVELSTDPTSRLRAAGCVFAEDEARLLLAAADDERELETMVRRRETGVPLEQILGWAEFCGLRIGVAPGVFVPRTRTALLVEEAAARARSGHVVVDMCCGTGAVAAAIADRVDGLDLYATDLDPAATLCATRNLAGTAQVLLGDLDAALPPSLTGRVDLLVVNAPYVPTEAIATMPPEARDHERRVALDGGQDGVGMHRRVAAAAFRVLAPTGLLLIETSLSQASLTSAAMTAQTMAAEVVTDPERDATVVIGSRSG